MSPAELECTSDPPAADQADPPGKRLRKIRNALDEHTIAALIEQRASEVRASRPAAKAPARSSANSTAAQNAQGPPPPLGRQDDQLID